MKWAARRNYRRAPMCRTMPVLGGIVSRLQSCGGKEIFSPQRSQSSTEDVQLLLNSNVAKCDQISHSSNRSTTSFEPNITGLASPPHSSAVLCDLCGESISMVPALDRSGSGGELVAYSHDLLLAFPLFRSSFWRGLPLRLTAFARFLGGAFVAAMARVFGAGALVRLVRYACLFGGALADQFEVE